MGRKKKNKKRNNQPTITAPENPPFIDRNEADNRQLIDDYEFSDTSSESGKSDFDDEYQRHRPAPIPIDPSRIRRIKKPQIFNNVDGDDNDDDDNSNDIWIKVDKAQHRRSDDEICTPSTSNTQMETGINDGNMEETRDNPIEFSGNSGKKKRRKKRKSVVEKPDNVTENNSKRGKKKRKKRSRRQKKQSSEDQQMPKLNHPKNNKLTRIQIDTMQYIEEVCTIHEKIGAEIDALVDLIFTTKKSYPRFLELTETIKTTDFQIDYVHIPILVDVVDEVCNKQVENVGKKQKKKKKKKHCRECRKNTVQVTTEKKSKFATNENCHLTYAEMLKTKLIVRQFFSNVKQYLSKFVSLHNIFLEIINFLHQTDWDVDCACSNHQLLDD